ncbi:MAG: hypothetical protein IPH75_12415 [bacterium]|nr:hypothetical protein [bacterium]
MRPVPRYAKVTIYTLIIFLFLAAASSWAGSDKISSRFAVNPITIDGRYDDWKDHPTTFLEEQKAVIAVANDADNLYLLFRTNDPRWVRTIAMSGLTVYLDPKGGKKKDFFVKFIGGPSREQMLALRKQEVAERKSEERQMPERMQQRMEERMPDDSIPKLICYIKDQIDEKEIPLDGTEGPSVAFDTSHAFFVYEFAIPMKESEVRSYGFGAIDKKELSVGLVWGEMEMMRGERPREGMDFGGSGGGMGGGPGGGMGGGPGGGMGGGMGRGGAMGGPGGGMQRPSKQEVWVKTTLAKE